MDGIWKTVSFGIGRKNSDERVDHELFDSPAWKLKAIAPLKEMARQQLGTVGSGNHYVNVFAGERDRVWIGVHFGSRGFGHKTATAFLKAAGATDGMDVDPCVLPMKRCSLPACRLLGAKILAQATSLPHKQSRRN